MGSSHVKCQCRNFSTTKIIVNYNSEEPNLFYRSQEPNRITDYNSKELYLLSGYIGWSMILLIKNIICEAYPCNNCAEIIIENFNKNNIIFRIKKFPKGLKKINLPLIQKNFIK